MPNPHEGQARVQALAPMPEHVSRATPGAGASRCAGRPGWSFRLKAGLTISLFSLLLAGVSVVTLFLRTEHTLVRQAAGSLEEIAKAYRTHLQGPEFSGSLRRLSEAVNAIRPSEQALVSLKPGASLSLDDRQRAGLLRRQGLEADYRTLVQTLQSIKQTGRQDNQWDDVFIHDAVIWIPLPDQEPSRYVRAIASAADLEDAARDCPQCLGSVYAVPDNQVDLTRAFHGQRSSDGRIYHNDSGTFIAATMPIRSAEGEVLGVLSVSMDGQGLVAELQRLRWISVAIVVIAGVVGALLSMLLSHWLSAPVTALREGAERVKARDFGTRICIRSRDELALLADTFNDMVEEVGGYAARLEQQVAERTQELARAKQELENDLKKGRRIQRDFLPDPIPDVPGWEIRARFEPARQVAGDFYDVFALDDGRVGLVIADVCDKGVGAAMFMGLFRSFIRLFSNHARLPGLNFDCRAQAGCDRLDLAPGISAAAAEALGSIPLTNDYIARQHGKTVMFATLFCGVLDPRSGCLTYLNGGHEPLFLLRDGRLVESLEHSGPAVGMMPDMRFQVRQTCLRSGDLLVGYTDGVTEARDPTGAFFGAERLRDLLNTSFQSADQALEAITNEVSDYMAGAPQFDDITLLSIKRLSPSPAPA